MLEGLEVSEIYYSDLERTLRVDSEFYSKENLQVIDILERLPLKNITEIVNVSDGNHMSISDNFTEEGIPYYRGQDIHNFFIEDANSICIDYETYLKPVMKRSHLKKGDVLLSIVGTIGGVSLVSSNNNATCSCKLAIFRPHSIDGFFLSAFLKSKYGQNQIKKFTRGAVQMGLILEDMNQIMVPDLSSEFQIRVSTYIQEAKEKSNLSIETYKQAETILLETLGLNNFEINSDAVNVKGFKESFLSTGRLDAEYYQKKFEEIIKHIRSGKFDKLGNLVTIKKSIEPGSEAYQEEGIPFVRVSNLTKYGLSYPDIYLDKLEYADVIRPKKDTILLSKDGTVGIAYKVPEDMFAITSGAILHLQVKSDEVLPDYLTLVLNSLVVQMQAERDAGGSILQHWKPSEIEQVEIPIIDKNIQIQISELIQESFRLKKESEQLLDLAKRAVEIAIEEGEERAMEMITSSKLLVN